MPVSHRLPSLPPWDHWPVERLRQEKEGNPRSFARGFQQKAFTDDERMFPSFSRCFAPGVLVADITRRGWPVFVGVDLSSPKRPGNVIFVGALDPVTQRRYPLEVLTGNWTSPETARRLHEVHARHPNIRCILVEDNAYQGALIDWIKGGGSGANWWWKVEAFTTGANKASIQIGLPSLELEFHHKQWVIPISEFEHHPAVTCACGWCTWRSEMRDYPMSAQSDTVMACWFFREAISRWGASGNAMANMVKPGFNTR